MGSQEGFLQTTCQTFGLEPANRIWWRFPLVPSQAAVRFFAAGCLRSSLGGTATATVTETASGKLAGGRRKVGFWGGRFVLGHLWKPQTVSFLGALSLLGLDVKR